jgi:hypothetical protein
MKRVLPIVVVAALFLISCSPGKIVDTTEPVAAIQEEPSPFLQEDLEVAEPTSTAFPEATEVLTPIVETEVIDVNWFVDNHGLNVFGLVKNTGNVDLENVTVTLFLRSPDGTLIGRQYGLSSLRVLSVDQISPFWLNLKADPDLWETYEITVEAKQARLFSPYKNIDIIRADGNIPADGAYEIIGEIKNTGGQNAKKIDVIGILFDQDGHIIGTRLGKAADERLATGSSSPFTLMFSQIAEGEVASFEIIVFSEVQ